MEKSDLEKVVNDTFSPETATKLVESMQRFADEAGINVEDDAMLNAMKERARSA